MYILSIVGVIVKVCQPSRSTVSRENWLILCIPCIANEPTENTITPHTNAYMHATVPLNIDGGDGLWEL